MIHYFAYGSNLHPVRLTERVPSASLVGAIELARHRLRFHKKGRDGSGKCNLSRTESTVNSVHGALYELNPAHKSLLDRYEGRGAGYADERIDLQHRGREYTCFTYLAQRSHVADNLRPFHWYKQLVVLGAKYLEFPEAYVSSIESVASMQDPDHARRKESETLIEKINDYR